MPSTLLAEDPNDLTTKYNTELSPEEEQAFTAWAKKQGKTGDLYDYDLRGAWKELQSGEMKVADNGHLGDKYKKPNHPTFSDQSIYNGIDGMSGGTWSEDEDGNTVFTPSQSNLKNMSEKEMKAYFAKVEPGVILNIPKSAAEKLYSH